MGLEAATYIHQLNSANPLSSDGLGQADDHIRMIKGTIRNSFPNITGVVTATQDTLNIPVPMGVITLWYGSAGDVPVGWAICDGRFVNRTDGGGAIQTPSLVNVFVLGAGGDVDPHATGGAWQTETSESGAFKKSIATTSKGKHNHGSKVASTKLTPEQLPPHNHTIAGNGSGVAAGVLRVSAGNLGGDGDPAQPAVMSAKTGVGDGHDHSVAEDGEHAHDVTVEIGDHTHVATAMPPFITLLYIMKV